MLTREMIRHAGIGGIYAEYVKDAIFLNVARSFAYKDPMKPNILVGMFEQYKSGKRHYKYLNAIRNSTNSTLSKMILRSLVSAIIGWLSGVLWELWWTKTFDTSLMHWREASSQL